MKKNSTLLTGIFALLLLLVSCTKEFDSTAPYKDVTVVYALLDAGEMDHYVKIYKGFLTNGNAYDAAQINDSLYYYDKIDAVVEEYLNGRLNATIPMAITTDYPREMGGDFASPDQIVYKFTRELNPNALYKLVITNKESGRVITSETNVIGDFYLKVPSSIAWQIGIHSVMPTNIEFSNAANANSYDVYQTFYYIERNRVTHEEVTKSIRRKLNAAPLTRNTMQYTPANLLNVLAGTLEADPNIDRYISVDSCLCFEVWAANDVLTNYVANNNISGSVVLDKLNYTNIQCADGRVTGLWASRRHTEGWHGLTTASQDELVHGDLTGHLHFHYAYEYQEE